MLGLTVARLQLRYPPPCGPSFPARHTGLSGVRNIGARGIIGGDSVDQSVVARSDA